MPDRLCALYRALLQEPINDVYGIHSAFARIDCELETLLKELGNRVLASGIPLVS